MDGNFSIVQYVSEQEKHKCGYCKQLSSSTVHGMFAHSLTVQDYQDLIDRGWRRSGKYCYKPIMDITCCPMYTIRCEALQLKLSKSQKKILKRVNKFLTDGAKDHNDDTGSENSFDNKNEAQSAIEIMPSSGQKPMEIDTGKIIHLEEKLPTEENQGEHRLQPEVESPLPSCTLLNKETKSENKLDKEKQKIVQNSLTDQPIKKIDSDYTAFGQVVGEGMDPSRPPCKKAKLMRIERKRQKLAAAGKEINLVKNAQPNEGKTLEQFLSEVPTNSHHKLRISLVRTTPKSEEWKRTCKVSHDVYVKYQMAIHGSTREQCSEKQFNRFLVESPLQLELKRMNPKEPTFEASAKLYAKYQMTVHKDPQEECTSHNYIDFLVSTPLQAMNTQNGPPDGYGSFHQQYWLDDNLIAVGVIDILPKCVSSVYFFYDPDYSHLSLGTYGSLRELQFTRELYKKTPELQYYYMGYYIHSCPKMRYKASLIPSYLLCPETYSWFPIEPCLTKINIDAYARFNDDPDAKDPYACTNQDIKSIPFLCNYKVYEYGKYQSRCGHDCDNELIEYANLVGKKCASRMIFVKD